MTMTDDELKQLSEETTQKSMVIIEFLGLGQSEFRIYRQNVTPAQVLGALQILELETKNWYIMEENRRRQEQLAVPRPEILRPK